MTALFGESPLTAFRYTRVGDQDRSLLLLRDWAPIHVEPHRRFVSAHKKFLVYWKNAWGSGWFLSKISEEGAHIEVKNQQGNEFLFSVTE